MQALAELIEDTCSLDVISTVARNLYFNYHAEMSDDHVWALLNATFPQDLFSAVRPFKPQILGHVIVNEIVTRYYPGEKIIKYHLIHGNLANQDEVTALEINTGTSRLDVGQINGQSHAYEIKTEFDSTSKLDKQMCDYGKCFEYLNIVTHEKHLEKVLELVPPHCGIIIYHFDKGACSFFIIRDAQPNPDLNYQNQVQNLTSSDLAFVLKAAGFKEVPSRRQNREQAVLQKLSPSDINELFKQALKKKFEQRWQFVKDRFQDILPIDVQFFFASLADPRWVYYKNSSIV
ncbi:MAG: sce7726 family protein [Bacillota bacterium]